MKKNYLQLPQTSIALAAFVFLFVLFFWGCNQVENVSPLFNQTFANTADPQIVSVSPDDSAFAGIDELTIMGHNFSTVSAEMLVFFNTTIATILSIDSNKIVVRAPNIVQDSISIKIDKLVNALKTSNTVSYKLVSATQTIKEFSTGNRPYMITLDNSANVYYSSTLNNISEGIIKVTPDLVTSEYAKKGGETYYSGLKFAKTDGLLGSRRVTAIFKIASGSTPVTYVSGFSKAIADFDYDANGSIWAVSSQDQIYRVNPTTKDKKTFTPGGLFRVCRVFNSYLYVAGQKSTSDKSEIVWRFPIVNADSIGTAEVYFDFSAAGYSTVVNSVTIQGMTFSQDGFLYIGNDGEEPIIIVNPIDKSSAPLFPGVLNPTKKNKLISLFWGEGYYLYYVRQIINTDDKTAPLPLSDAIVKVNTKKLGAPYFGNN